MNLMHKFDETDGVDSDWLLEAAAKRKKIMLFLALAAVIVVLAAVSFRMRARMVEGEKKTQTQRRIFELNDEIRAHEKQLEELAEKYAGKINGSSCVIFAFTNLAKGDAKEALDSMNARGYAGLMVFTDGRIPGDVNCITVEEYKALLDKGWEAAIGGFTNEVLSGIITEYAMTKWEKSVKNVRQKFADKGLEVPRIYCFNEGENGDDMDSLLENMGFSTYIVISDKGAGSWFSGQGAERGRLSGIQADYDCGTMEAEIQSNVEKGYSCVFLFNRIEFGYPQNDTGRNTSIARFKAILDKVGTTGRPVNVTTVSGYRAYQAELDRTMTGERAEYVRQRDEVLQKIDGLKAEAKRLREDLS